MLGTHGYSAFTSILAANYHPRCLLFAIGAVLQAAAYSLAQMAVGRLVVGFGVGSAAMVVPLYIAEIAPTNVRGRMIGLNNMSITGGQVVSYGIGAAFAHVPHGWRYMVGLGAVPAIILGCCLYVTKSFVLP
jgi:MFS transporter, SP family, solute carrier family 2 (myo-inositol transporter), member 13